MTDYIKNKSSIVGEKKTIGEQKRLRQLLDELHEENKEQKRAEDILNLIRQRDWEKKLDETLARHAKVCAKIFLNKVFLSIINDKK